MRTAKNPRHCLFCLLGGSISFVLLAAAVSFGVTDAFDEAVREVADTKTQKAVMAPPGGHLWNNGGATKRQ